MMRIHCVWLTDDRAKASAPCLSCCLSLSPLLPAGINRWTTGVFLRRSAIFVRKRSHHVDGSAHRIFGELSFFLKEHAMDDQSLQKSPARKDAGLGTDGLPMEKDLSQEIERAVEREPLDQVRCIRVFGNYYRCNWWSHMGGPRTRPESNWAGLIMDSVRKSRFLSATMQGGELVIKDVSLVAVGRVE